MNPILAFILLFFSVYTIVALFKPLSLYKTRKRALYIGLPLMVFALIAADEVTRFVDKPTPTLAASQQNIPEAQATKNPDKKANDIANIGVTKIQQIESNQKVERTPKKYDPQSASDATGETIRALDEFQLRLTGYAAQFVTMTDWCNYSYFVGDDNPVKSDLGQLGVHPFDFKILVRQGRKKALNIVRNLGSWKQFCGTTIYEIFGKNGQLFGVNGEFPNAGPWLKRIELKPDMTKRQVEAEVEFNVAYYGAARCFPRFTDFNYDKEQAYKKRYGLDEKWYEASSGQWVPFINETFFRLGPESLMNCSKYREKYPQLWPEK